MIKIAKRCIEKAAIENAFILIGQRQFAANTSPKRQRVNDLRQGSLAGASGLYFWALSPKVTLSN